MDSRVEINRWLVLTNSASSIVTHLLNITVVVWVHQHLLRRISPEEYAVYPLIVGFIALVPVFSAIFLSGAGRYAVDAYARGDDRRLKAVASTLIPLMVLVAIALLVTGSLAAWKIHAILKLAPEQVSDARWMLMLLMSAAAVRITLTPLGLGLYVRQKFVVLNVLQLGGQTLRLALLLILLLGVSTRIIWLVVAAAAMEVFVATAQVAISRRVLPALRFERAAFDWRLARELMAFGTWSTITNVLGLVRTTLQPLLLNWYATPLDVTCFGVAVMIQSELQRASILATTPLHPPVTAMHALEDCGGLRHAFLRGSRYALWAITFCVVPLIIFRREFISLYIGDQFALTTFVLAAVLIPMMFRYATFMTSHVASASANLRPVALRGLVVQAAIVALTLYFVVARQMGAIGTGLAMLIAGVVLVPLLVWPIGLRMADATLKQWLRETVGPGYLPALTGGVTWFALHWFIEPDSWLLLAMCVAAGGLVFATTLVTFCLYPYEREDLRRILGRLRTRT